MAGRGAVRVLVGAVWLLASLRGGTASPEAWFCYDAGVPGTPFDFGTLPTGYELAQVQFIVRHGIRTPLSELPANNPTWYCQDTSVSTVATTGQEAVAGGGGMLFQTRYSGYTTGENPLPGNCTLGYMTKPGVEQIRSIGRGLKALLSGFVSPVFNETEVFLRSSDIDRTRQTAYVLAQELFAPPPAGQPAVAIPVHSVDIDYDHTTGDDADPERCPNVTALLSELKAKPAWQAVLTGLAALAPVVDKHYGGHFGTLRNFVGRVPDHFMMIQCNNMSYEWPTDITPEYLSKLYHWYDQWWAVLEMAPRMSLIQMGRMVKLLGDALEAASTGADTHRLRVYVGHDLTIGPLMVNFGVPTNLCAPWAGHIMLQLLRSTAGPSKGSLAVRFLFDGRVQRLPMCHGQELCPLDLFLAGVRNITAAAAVQLQTYCNQTL